MSHLLLQLLLRRSYRFHQPAPSHYLHRQHSQHLILSPLKPIHSLLGSCPPSFQLLRQTTPPDQTGPILASSTQQPTLPIPQQRTLVPNYPQKVLSRPQQRNLIPKYPQKVLSRPSALPLGPMLLQKEYRHSFQCGSLDAPLQWSSILHPPGLL